MQSHAPCWLAQPASRLAPSVPGSMGLWAPPRGPAAKPALSVVDTCDQRRVKWALWGGDGQEPALSSRVSQARRPRAGGYGEASIYCGATCHSPNRLRVPCRCGGWATAARLAGSSLRRSRPSATLRRGLRTLQCTLCAAGRFSAMWLAQTREHLMVPLTQTASHHAKQAAVE